MKRRNSIRWMHIRKPARPGTCVAVSQGREQAGIDHVKPGGRTEPPKPRIAYILSMFPALSETFILRELLELERSGVELTILSLKPFTDRIVHPEAQSLMTRVPVHYASPCRGLARFAWLALSRPAKVVKLAADFHASFQGSSLSLVKSFTAMVLASDLIPILRARECTHVHAPWATYPATAALFCSRMAGYSFSFSARAHDLFLEDHGLAVKFREARFAQTITEYNRLLIERRYFRQPNPHLHVIHSALNPEEFRARPEPFGTPMVLSIGRMVEMKGFAHLIEACALMRDQGVAFTCCIVGQGPLHDDLSRLIQQRRLADRVHLRKPMAQAEIRRLLAQATCFVLPCITANDGDQDGIPNVLMEAMASGVPVVSCPTSGVPELVQHGRTGLLARPRDPESLSQQIVKLLLDPQLRDRLAEAGRRKVESDFDIRKTAAKLASLFPVRAG